MNTILHSHVFPSNQRLELVQGDITAERVDAIVNAANKRLMHGGGVAANIARKGGALINQESADWVKEHGPVSHADPAYTSGGELHCKYVIHAVGPKWGAGKEDKKLAETVRGSLRVAEELELVSIAFPAISTGIYNFPKDRAAKVIYTAIGDYFKRNPESGIKQVRITLFDEDTTQVFQTVWDKLYAE